MTVRYRLISFISGLVLWGATFPLVNLLSNLIWDFQFLNMLTAWPYSRYLLHLRSEALIIGRQSMHIRPGSATSVHIRSDGDT